ncbi:Cell division protein 50 [Spironucleus salmonicida]|uniref:Cell division protein 50 n=1 Tax=Spironucleus salmonicida TaxID=348837 RepID=V6M1U0_9EUKA|nr:Cell division protein 50 [Spironucleus salmonicida]|eukprot:EST47159.1 Cell division protein 50 [Spironucleus salmonicida]
MGLISIDAKAANQRFFQQTLHHCIPISHPGIVIIVLSIFGGFLVVIGGFFYQQALGLSYIEVEHTNSNTPQEHQFTLDNFNPNQLVHVYYRVPNFFQNIRSYVQSFSLDQLKAKNTMLQAKVNEDCDKPTTAKPIVQYPCGMQFKSMNRDTYSFKYQNSTQIVLNKDNIAFPGDIKQNTLFGVAFKRFDFAQHFGVPTMTWQDVANWMRPSAFSSAQKYYGAMKLDNNKLILISNGSHMNGTLVFSEKRIIIVAQLSSLGGKAETAATSICCMVTGCISAVSALVFAIIASIKGPRSKKYETEIDKLRVITNSSIQIEEIEKVQEARVQQVKRQLGIK